MPMRAARLSLRLTAAAAGIILGASVFAPVSSAAARGAPLRAPQTALVCFDTAEFGRPPCIDTDLPDEEHAPRGPARPRGYTGMGNPAAGQVIPGSAGDPLGMFAQRPLEHYIIPEGGMFLDPLHDGPHYGVDYANPDDYLDGQTTYFYPIAPGYVTTRASCPLCFVDGDAQGRVGWKWPRYNFGWGGLVLVETPYSAEVSIYTLYAHLDRDFASLGDYVTPDTVLGAVGTTGYSEEFHLHMEIRYGPPGSFWAADFGEWATLDRWLATMFVNPAWVVFPENHALLADALGEWSAQRPLPDDIP